MTPKEKAQELVDKFTYIDNGDNFQIIGHKDRVRAKQCALIAVDEVIKTQGNGCMECGGGDMEYWQEVKQEIEKL